MEWVAFEKLEPFQEAQTAYGFASVVQVLANVHRNKSHRKFDLEDAVIRHGDDPRRELHRVQDWKQMKAIGQMMSAVFSEEQ